ncbi:hypothetical protein PIROE2DRAFT_7457, partial [Piromyces sp. E2]
FSICPSCILKNLLDFYVLLFSIVNESNGEFLNGLSKNAFIFQYLESSQQNEIPILNKNNCNGISSLNKLNEQNGNYSVKQILLLHNNIFSNFCYEVQVNVKLLKNYFFKNDYKENLLFDVLRQSLLQGFDKYEVIAETIGIIHSNIFLKCNNIYDNENPEYNSNINELIRKFIKALRLVFLERKESSHKFYKEKTMFYVWTQSPIMEEQYWIQLKEELSVSINEWEQVIDEWNKIMICLTNDLSKYAFNVNFEVHNKYDRFKRNRSKSCVVETISNNIPSFTSGENDNKKQINQLNTITTPIKINNKSLTVSNNNSLIINELYQNEKEFKKIQYNIKRKLTTSEIMNIWKNTLCVIGNPNKITIRDSQQYVHNIYPPILEFSSWIFQSVDTPKYI